MSTVAKFIYYLFHLQELRALLQWYFGHLPVHARNESQETQTLRRCFYYLDKTSRSFSAVIKELNPELLAPICLFYLILRGLDTVEDDMTIPIENKDPLLRDFHNILQKSGWTYEGNHVREKDRDLLVNFDVVITEFKRIKPQYQAIIADITKRMGNGMADFASKADLNVNGIDSTKNYELYCHYVAGLVGEGLTRLFVESKLANPALLERPELHESMGQFLQQVNIIRDVREDYDGGRKFWPREIWSKHVEHFEDLFKDEYQEQALNCSSEMIHNALRRADQCLFYLAGMRDQSVFNFAAIPQSMAIATLEICFRNPNIFKKNVKITRGQACQLMLASTQNVQILYRTFRRYAQKILKKNKPTDPSFLSISIACAKIEQFTEKVFPSQTPGPKVVSSVEQERLEQLAREEMEENYYLFGSAILTFVVIILIMVFVGWIAGARFDLAWKQMQTFPRRLSSSARTSDNYEEL